MDIKIYCSCGSEINVNSIHTANDGCILIEVKPCSCEALELKFCNCKEPEVYWEEREGWYCKGCNKSFRPYC